ncbi:hypothetical protein R1flu_009570 [Riccia fluitans]|uniref:MATH domain-containing protein n=1 Tax=Riccia fluitans TaxID=41844 RepID=A0ABD1Z2H3_9MARC
MLSNILERHGRANQRLASLEEDLAHAKLEEEKLKATIAALREKEKSRDECQSGIDGEEGPLRLVGRRWKAFNSQPSGTIGGFENLNLTITKKWVEITLNLEEFEKCPVDYPDFEGYSWNSSKFLAVFEYMRSIFDSYINPTNDPNVQPLVKGLDADDFSVDKFFDLQDQTTPDDAQVSLDFEEDLRINQRVRLRVEVRNLGASRNG